MQLKYRRSVLILALAWLPSLALAQSTTLVSVNSIGQMSDNGASESSISGDGRYVVFVSGSSNLPPYLFLPNIYIHDLVTSQTDCVSVGMGGAPEDGSSSFPSISSNGRYVTFVSHATNLVPGDTNSVADLFVRDVITGLTVRANVDSSGVQANAEVYPLGATISADGHFVAFTSSASNLVTGDTNASFDVFVRDLQAAQTSRVSVATTGSQADDSSYFSSIDAGGRFVAFMSLATNLVLGDTNGYPDVFVRDLQLGQTIRVSVDSLGVQGDLSSSYPSISGNGRCVAFESDATNLAIGDTNSRADIFVRDLQAGQTRRASVDSSGVQGNNNSSWASISEDARFVSFNSTATNLVPGDLNARPDVFVRDLYTDLTTCLSVSTAGVQGDDGSFRASCSASGRFVTFYSYATTLIQGGSNGHPQVYVRDQGPVGCTQTLPLAPTGLLANAVSGTLVALSWVDNANNEDGFNVERALAGNGVWLPLGTTVPDATSFQDTSAACGTAYDYRVTAFNCAGSSGATQAGGSSGPCCAAPTSYCTAKVNSAGCLPGVSWSGTATSSGAIDDFYVTASNVLNQKPGLMIWSTLPGSTPLGGGTLCLAPPVIRSAGQMSGGSPTPTIDCTGQYSFHFGHAYIHAYFLAAGQVIRAQYWSRDPGFAAPNKVGLTNALTFTVCP